MVSAILALFTVCAVMPFSASAKDEIALPSLKVETIETLNVGSGAQDNSLVKNSNKAGNIPSSYSSVEKGFVTIPKDQGQNGTCWTFAAASMAESSILSSGGTYGGKKADVDEINFSEAQIAYFTYSKSYDPLGNLNGDATNFYNNEVLTVGGNHYFTTLAFASWKGLCEDEVMPYDELVAGKNDYAEDLSYEASVRLENAIWTNMADMNTVKKLVMENGSVVTDYFHEDMFLNHQTSSYYCAVNYGTNHAITVVGWDDNYSRDNFLETPAGDGAWLMKNSWGEDWGNGGYFWISYYDATVKNNAATCMQFTDAEKYDNNYQYDGSCMMSYVYLPSGWVVANSFTTSAYEEEKLEAVSFATMTAGVDYTVRIFKNNDDVSMADGEDVLKQPIKGHVDYAGYHTIEIEDEIILEKGEEYLVCITLTSETEEYIMLMVDGSDYDVDGGIEFVNNTANDRSYYGVEHPQVPSGIYLQNLVADNNVTARIKAFTTNVGEEDDNDDDDDFWEDLFDWFHTIINGIDTSHKVGEIINLIADFYYDEKGYAHRFSKWVCDSENLEIDEYSADISFAMPSGDVELHAEYVIVGDVDGNEKVNAFDMIALSKRLKNNPGDYLSSADIDGNNRLNAFDSISMKKYLTGTYKITK